jgi:3-hydroxyisobutyrate dehydrogenase
MHKESIGWIGTGVMGSSMCSHLIRAGHEVSLHTRTKGKALSLLDMGARWCNSPGEVASGTDFIFSIVGYPEDVEEVYFSGNGLLDNARPGSVLVDMTTSRPSLACRIHGAAREKGCHSLDAPVSGGDVGAAQATLAIMVGGDDGVYKKTLPLLNILGKSVSLMGGPGSGQHTKMCNQIAIASGMVGVVESMLYARKAGLDPSSVIDITGAGAAGSWSLNNLGRRIVKNDFNPGFFIKHFIKDLGIALDEARRMCLALPGLALAHQFYAAASALDLEDLGTQGLYKVLERLNGMDQEEL